MEEKSSNVERARQFMPFAALRGFEELIRAQTRENAPKRELSEYEAERLSKKMSAIKKGDLVRVRYYAGDGYTVLEGMVSDLDISMRRLRVIKTEIAFDDISDITRMD